MLALKNLVNRLYSTQLFLTLLNSTQLITTSHKVPTHGTLLTFELVHKICTVLFLREKKLPKIVPVSYNCVSYFYVTHQHKQQYQYNNNGKPNPDDVVLYLYTTYDSNSFHPISSRSYPMTLR